MSLSNYSIGAKIFGAFVAMSVIIGVMGLAGYGVLSAAGNIAVTTFDGPLMAINYARAAQTDFTEMQLAELRFEHAPPEGRTAIAAEIGEIAATFADDLDVTAQRSLAEDEQRVIAQIAPLVKRWREARGRGDHAALERLDQQID
ncbi:MAG TPA: MCP four helix bundle domain-containing protein, partial [Rhizomicrobium sp.]|nr:MCP four helix bundle domain-containing protein [Rhizomicrobium sp.]